MHFLIVHAVWVILWPVRLKDSRSCRAIWLMGMCKSETVLLSLSSVINKVHLKLSQRQRDRHAILFCWWQTSLKDNLFRFDWSVPSTASKTNCHVISWNTSHLKKKRSNQWFSYEKLFKIKHFLRILWVWDCFWKTFRCGESGMPCDWSFIILLSEWSPVHLKSSTSQVQRSQKASDNLTLHGFYVIFQLNL